MKILASGHVHQTNVVTEKQALDYIWSQSVSTIISGMDSGRLLEANVETAKTFKSADQTDQAVLLVRTKDKGVTGDYEPFKTPPTSTALSAESFTG